MGTKSQAAGREAGELLLALGQLAQQQNYAASSRSGERANLAPALAAGGHKASKARRVHTVLWFFLASEGIEMHNVFSSRLSPFSTSFGSDFVFVFTQTSPMSKKIMRSQKS